MAVIRNDAGHLLATSMTSYTAMHRRAQRAESEVAKLRRQVKHRDKLLRDAYASRDRLQRRLPLRFRLVAALAGAVSGFRGFR